MDITNDFEQYKRLVRNICFPYRHQNIYKDLLHEGYIRLIELLALDMHFDDKDQKKKYLRSQLRRAIITAYRKHFIVVLPENKMKKAGEYQIMHIETKDCSYVFDNDGDYSVPLSMDNNFHHDLLIMDEFEHLIRKLPMPERDLLHMIIKSQSVQEAADRLGISIETLRTRFNRIKRRVIEENL